MIIAVGATIVATIIGTIVMAIGTAIGAEITGRGSSKDIDRKDERDVGIDRRGELVGYYVLSVGVLGVLVLAMLRYDHFWIANALYLSFVVGAVVSSVAKIVALSQGLLAMVKPTRVTNSIRALRFAASEMTQSELADRVGVTRQTIIAIEQGRYSPSLEMAFRIANVFGVPLNDVFHYPEES